MVDENDLGVLAAHGQQLVQREGGGAEDGLEGDGLDVLSPQLTQRGQRDAEGGCEPSDADGEGIAALGAGVGDALAVLVGDSQAEEGRGGCGRGGRAAVRRGRRLLGDNRSFRLHRAGDRDLIDDLAVGIGGSDFCARTQLVLDGVEVELTAVLREGLAVALGSLASLGGQLEAARQIDVVAVDAVAAVAVFAVAAVGSNRTAGDGDVEAADAVAAAAVRAVAAVGSNRTAGDGDAAAAAADAVAAVAVLAVAAIGVDRTAGDGDAAVAVDAAAAAEAAAVTAIGSDRTTAGDGDAAAAADAVAAAAVRAASALGSDRTTAGDGDAASAVDTAAAVVAVGSDRTAGDGEVAAAGDAAAAVVAVGSDRTAGDGEAAAAVDAAAVDVALQRVVAIQLDIGVALAGHAYGGFVPAAGVDVHILECDLDLIVLTVGVDGHGVGRSGTLITICDDGVGVFHLLIRPL